MQLGSMYCPECNRAVRVVEVVNNYRDGEVYRKRECPGCGRIFFTVEYEVVVNEQFEKNWNTKQTPKKWR